MDAVEMLTQDHERVRSLFKKFEGTEDGQEQRQILDELIKELRIHSKLEEQVFYPAAREQVQETEDQVKESVIEHDQAETLMRSLQQMSPDNEEFEAKVTVLKEEIEHHAGEEESEMFPQVRKSLSTEQLAELGRKMQELKQKLQG